MNSTILRLAVAAVIAVPALQAQAQTKLAVSPTALNFLWKIGDPNPAPVDIGVSSNIANTGFTVKVGIVTQVNWLSVSPGGGTTGAPNIASSLHVTVLPAGIGEGSFVGNITIESTGSNPDKVVIPVTLTATSGVLGTQPDQIKVEPALINTSFRIGQSFPGLPKLAVSSTGTTQFNFIVQTTFNGSGSWLTVSPTSGKTPADILMTVNTVGLEGGTYTANIAIVTAGATGGSAFATVNLTVTPSTLKLDKTSLNLTYRAPDTNAVQGVIALNASSDALDFTATTSTPWLALLPASGRTPAGVLVTAAAAGLATGTYNGSIAISAPGASNPSQTIPVTLNVTQQPTLNPTPTSLSFIAITDGSVPGAQTLSIGSSGGSLAFTAAAISAPWLRITPSSGTTPATLTVSAAPGTLGVGTYQGSISIAATGAGNSPKVVPVALTLTQPTPIIGAITHAATLTAGAVAPGEIVTLFGTFLGPSTLVSAKGAGGVFEKSLGGTTVTFDEVAAPLIYASATQVSAILPYGVAGRTSTQVKVVVNGAPSRATSVNVVDAAPGLFTANSSGKGPGAILNEDYGLNAASRPAPRGSIVILYATGEGQTVPFGVDGKIVGTEVPLPVLPVSVRIGGVDAEVLYAGEAPGLVAGVMQVNVRVPDAAQPGDAVPVLLTVGKNTSPAGVTMSLK